MSTLSADPTADILLHQIRLIKRIGTPDQKAAALRWENLIRSAAETDEPMAVNFAQAAAQDEALGTTPQFATASAPAQPQKQEAGK